MGVLVELLRALEPQFPLLPSLSLPWREELLALYHSPIPTPTSTPHHTPHNAVPQSLPVWPRTTGVLRSTKYLGNLL